MAKILKRGEQQSMVSSFNFEVKQFGEPEERQLRFIGSDETPDRDGDIISVNGWDLNNYSKNPVFLWAHDASIPPVGKATSVKTENGKLMFDIEFPEKGIYPLADLVYNLYKGGFLNATSVGFIGREAEKRSDDAVKDLPEWQRGVKFNAQELLELSAVPVPSNPAALQQAKSAGKISNDEYSSLMSFISGEFVVNSNAGAKAMTGIKSVFANEEENIKSKEENKVEDITKEPETKEPESKEPEVTEPKVDEPKDTEPENKSADTPVESPYSFMLNPTSQKTLLVDNKSGKVLGDVTEEVKSLLSHATESIREQVEMEVKAGAALSKKNKSRLSQAKDLIIEVLGQVESDDSSIEDEKTGAIIPEEEEPTGGQDLSMSGNNKSADSDAGSDKGTKSPDEDEFEFELDEDDDKDTIEFDAEDVAEMIKSAVAGLTE